MEKSNVDEREMMRRRELVAAAPVELIARYATASLLPPDTSSESASVTVSQHGGNKRICTAMVEPT